MKMNKIYVFIQYTDSLRDTPALSAPLFAFHSQTLPADGGEILLNFRTFCQFKVCHYE